MDTFSFLSVLFSVIMGLALTEVLQSLRRLILARQRVTIYWPALIWAGLMIVIVAQAWWGMFGMRQFREWNMAMYAAVLLQITLMYLSAAVVLPEISSRDAIDMRAAYYANSRWFFGLLALTVTSTFLKDFATIGFINYSWNTAFLLTYILLSAIAAVSKSSWYHCILAPFSAVAIGTYAAVLSFRL